jgi:MFS family permease
VTDSEWRPLRRSGSPSFDLTEYLSTPFGKLARTHALGTFGDGMVTIALAGSIFFSVSPDAARWRVGLYLLLTVAPFAIVTPLIGPALDRLRGGRRMMVIASSLGRMVVAFLMIGHLDSFLLFPEAFALLVFQKSYSIAKSAIVPAMATRPDELVESN